MTTSAGIARAAKRARNRPLAGSLMQLVVLALSAFVFTLLLRAPAEPSPGQLPAIGSTLELGPTIPLPASGRIIAVSDFCEGCRRRAAAYLRHINNTRGELILVETSDPPFLRPIIQRSGTSHSQVLFLSPEEFRALGIRYVPAFIAIRPDGVVIQARPWPVGRIASALNPKNWASAWRELFRSAAERRAGSSGAGAEAT